MDDWSVHAHGLSVSSTFPSTHPMHGDPMKLYRLKRDRAHVSVAARYTILGFISSGTYGRVYKAQAVSAEGSSAGAGAAANQSGADIGGGRGEEEEDEDEDKDGGAISEDGGHGAARTPASDSGGSYGQIYAIKKFKPDKEGDVVAYTGISQSAIREISLNREISHENIVALKEVILEDKSIYMVFEYAEHDFLDPAQQVIHHHSQTLRIQIPSQVLKSLIYQLLNGLVYLHAAHILHRDLKPANILITAAGCVKIGDLGLARLARAPLQPLFAGDKVVVTIWYRAPELLLGARHYTRAVDCWAVGCVMAELASLRPIFKGEEAKMDSKKNVPFQRDQMLKILEVLGTPDEKDWPGLCAMPEYQSLKQLDPYQNRLSDWCQSRIRSPQGYELLRQLFAYDPEARVSAEEAMGHKWFQEEPRPTWNAFQQVAAHQLPPQRRITQDDAPSMMGGAPVHTSQTQAHAQVQAQGHGSTTSFGSEGGTQGRARKKARI